MTVEESWEDLIAAGIVHPPDDPDFDLSSWEPLDVDMGGISASERLALDRGAPR